MAEADLPIDIQRAFRLCRLTAIRKDEHRVRGLNAGDTLRRLVARTLAQQHAEEFRQATSPFNYGMFVHGGTESVVHLLRSKTDADPSLVLTKIDGIGAFDHVHRSSILGDLAALPTAHRLIPFALMSCGDVSSFVWTDDSGSAHEIHQGEGGEQGDALMPALFCLGMDAGLRDAASQLLPGEQVVAYLDDVYLLSSSARARAAYNVVTASLRHFTGIEPNLGKMECWSRGGGPPLEGI